MISLIITIVVIGLIVWLVNTYTPIDPKFKTLILVIALIVCVVYTLKVMGIWGGIDIPPPRIERFP